jgi:MoaA/NifB/PqqE/SkfB family radical SAM enzyme
MGGKNMNERKYIEGELILEVTRKCNLNCKHCLRGQCQDVNIKYKTIDATLEQFAYITCIVFTGGEPSLNVRAMRYTFEKIKELDIGLGSFYIVTNAVKYSPGMVKLCNEMYDYCDEQDCCGLAVSIDQFHGKKRDAYYLYRELPYYVHDKEQDNGKMESWMILDRGNAYENGIGQNHREISNFYAEYAEIVGNAVSPDGYVYVNAIGNVYFDCDLSYKMQDEIETKNIKNWDVASWMYDATKKVKEEK